MNQQILDSAKTMARETGKATLQGVEKGCACAEKLIKKGAHMVSVGLRKEPLQKARPVMGAIFCVSIGVALVSGVLYLLGRRK